MMKNQQYPSLVDFQDAMVVSLGAVEVIRQPLYDYAIYPTAGLGVLQFFVAQIGQGISASSGNGTNPKALSDTNMSQPGILPAPQAYWAQSLEVDFQPGSVSTANTFTIQDPSAHVAVAAAAVQAGANDKMNVLQSGALTFSIGTKPYYQEGPLYRYPTRPYVRLDTSISSNSATTAEEVKEYVSNTGQVLTFDPGLAIMTSLNFGVSITWPSVVATPSGFNGRLGVILDGFLFRAVQ